MRSRSMVSLLGLAAAAVCQQGARAEVVTTVMLVGESYDFDAGAVAVSAAPEFDVRLKSLEVFETPREPAIAVAGEASLADLKAPPARQPEQFAMLMAKHGYWIKTDDGAWVALVVKSIEQPDQQGGAGSVTIEYRVGDEDAAPEDSWWEPPPGEQQEPDEEPEWWITEGGMVRDAALCTGTDRGRPTGVSARFASTEAKVGLYLEIEGAADGTIFSVKWYRGERLLLREMIAVEGSQRAVVYVYPARSDRFTPGDYRVEVVLDKETVARLEFRLTAPSESQDE
ncbi:MAG: hypothetical protein ACE5O2_03325 [Armatimonadota bacterium]